MLALRKTNVIIFFLGPHVLKHNLEPVKIFFLNILPVKTFFLNIFNSYTTIVS